METGSFGYGITHAAPSTADALSKIQPIKETSRGVTYRNGGGDDEGTAVWIRVEYRSGFLYQY